jgi:hypothetical protein
MFLHKFIALAVLLAISVSSQDATLCANYEGKKVGCLFSKDAGANYEFRIETYEQVGYIAFGFGSSMADAEVYVAWYFLLFLILRSNDDEDVTLSRRESTGRREPTAVVQAQTVTDSSFQEGKLSVTFLRPKVVDGGASITSDSTPLIWAFTPAAVEGGDDVAASIQFHGDRKGGSGKSVNLLQSNKSAPTAPSSSPSKAYLTAHVYLMIFAWAISMPAGIFVARFMKAKLGVWWFRLHIAFMLVGALLVSFIALACVSAYTGSPWVDFSKYNAAGKFHVLFGVIVTVSSVLQVTSGFVIDKLYQPRRTYVPWYSFDSLTNRWDKMHWIAGRVSGSLGYVNIAFGIALYGSYGRDVSGMAITYGLWTVILIGLFVFASIRWGQTHDEPAKPSLKGYLSPIFNNLF